MDESQSSTMSGSKTRRRSSSNNTTGDNDRRELAQPTIDEEHSISMSRVGMTLTLTIEEEHSMNTSREEDENLLEDLAVVTPVATSSAPPALEDETETESYDDLACAMVTDISGKDDDDAVDPQDREQELRELPSSPAMERRKHVLDGFFEVSPEDDESDDGRRHNVALEEEGSVLESEFSFDSTMAVKHGKSNALEEKLRCQKEMQRDRRNIQDPLNLLSSNCTHCSQRTSSTCTHSSSDKGSSGPSFGFQPMMVTVEHQ